MWKVDAPLMTTMQTGFGFDLKVANFRKSVQFRWDCSSSMCSLGSLLPESLPIFSAGFGGDFELAMVTMAVGLVLLVVVTMKMRSGVEKECCL